MTHAKDIHNPALVSGSIVLLNARESPGSLIAANIPFLEGLLPTSDCNTARRGMLKSTWYSSWRFTWCFSWNVMLSNSNVFVPVLDALLISVGLIPRSLLRLI